MALPPKPTNTTDSLTDLVGPGLSHYQASRVVAAAEELARRSGEALRLYQPLPFQERFHSCTAKEAILMKGNQVGGSLAGFAEVARAVTGQDPHNKYPKEGGTAICIGFGEGHIGRNIHRYLFRSNAFRIIKDQITREWRVFRPWAPDREFNGMPGDAGREAETKPSPPLIPKRFISRISWHKRSEYIFSMVELTTGWTIYAANSAGDPNQFQGNKADLVHIDEDLAMPGWLPEMIGRTSAVDGKIRWTAMPHQKNDEMMQMIERAEDQETKANPETVCITATIYDNPFLPDKAREQNVRMWKSMGDDVYKQRALGQIDTESRSMYPSFSVHIHGAIKESEPRLEVQRLLTERAGEPPEDWCRYAAIDPGHQVCAVTFWAVPPPRRFGDFKVCYGELYLRQCDAAMLAKGMYEHTRDRVFEAFIIDMHGANLRELGSGVLPVRIFQQEFEKLGVVSRGTGSGFIAGCSDVPGRVLRLRQALAIRPDGTTEFLIVTSRCPMTVKEFIRFKKKTVLVNGTLTPLDDGERRNIHAVETVEYAVAHGLPYVKPVKSQSKKSWVDVLLEARRMRALARQMKHGSPQSSVISLGPS